MWTGCGRWYSVTHRVVVKAGNWNRLWKCRPQMNESSLCLTETRRPVKTSPLLLFPVSRFFISEEPEECEESVQSVECGTVERGTQRAKKSHETKEAEHVEFHNRLLLNKKFTMRRHSAAHNVHGAGDRCNVWRKK